MSWNLTDTLDEVCVHWEIHWAIIEQGVVYTTTVGLQVLEFGCYIWSLNKSM